MRLLLAILLLTSFGCEHFKRNGQPGDSGYITPLYLEVKVILFEPELIQEVNNGTVIKQAYSVVESSDKKRYRIQGKVGPVGDTFMMDVSLMKELNN